MTTFISNGNLLDYTPATAKTAGDIVFTGALCGQVATDLAAGQLGALRVSGVISVPKASATVFAEGSNVHWDSANSLAVMESTSGYMGMAVVGGGADGQTFVNVLLNVKHGVNALRARFTTAQVNAGATILPAIAGRRYRLHDASMIAIGGAAATATTVDILATQATSSVKLVANAVAGLTQNTLLRAGATNSAILAGGVSFAANDANTAVTIAKTGSSLATATHIDVLLTYTVE